MALTPSDWPGWPRGAPHPAAAWDRLGQERKALKEGPGAALEEALKPRVVCSGPSSPCTGMLLAVFHPLQGIATWVLISQARDGTDAMRCDG
ncbi:hypothetical protein Trisim1_002694 [Trichoderma cf. simile WF8]